MLDDVFSQMWRNQDLGIDRNYVDLRYLLNFFGDKFDPNKRHDIFQLLVLIVNHLTKETVPAALIDKIFKSKKIKNSDMIQFHKSGIVNQEFAVLTGLMHTCAKDHEKKIL